MLVTYRVSLLNFREVELSRCWLVVVVLAYGDVGLRIVILAYYRDVFGLHIVMLNFVEVELSWFWLVAVLNYLDAEISRCLSYRDVG